MLYIVSGVALTSEIPLPSCPRISTPTRQTQLCFRIGAPPLDADAIPDASWFERGPGVWVGRANKDAFVLRTGGAADFWLERDGTVTGVALGDCPSDTFAQLFLDHALPLALHLQGHMTLHASAVAVGGEVVAFFGASGAGKSTLASSLVQGGAGSLFSDDCLAIESGGGRIFGQPSYASTRLWSESAEAIFPERVGLPQASPRTSKLRASLPRAQGPLPVSTLYALAAADGPPAIATLRGREALMALASQLYRLDHDDPKQLAAEFELLTAVVRSAKVAKLSYRRSFADLDAVREAILADLRAEPGEGGS